MKIEHKHDPHHGVTRTLVDGQRVAGSISSFWRPGMARVFAHCGRVDHFFIAPEDAEAARTVIANAYEAGFEAAEAKHKAEQQRLIPHPDDPIVISLITERRVRELIAEGHNDLLESLGQLTQGITDLIGGLK